MAISRICTVTTYKHSYTLCCVKILMERGSRNRKSEFKKRGDENRRGIQYLVLMGEKVVQELHQWDMSSWGTRTCRLWRGKFRGDESEKKKMHAILTMNFYCKKKIIRSFNMINN